MTSSQAHPLATVENCNDPCSFDYVRNAPSSSGTGASKGSRKTKGSKSSSSKGSSFKTFFGKRVFKRKHLKSSAEPVPPVPAIPAPHQISGANTAFLCPPSNATTVSVESLKDLRIAPQGTKPEPMFLDLHEYEGESCPPVRPDDVRFQHPTVQGVRPITSYSGNASQISVASTRSSWPHSPGASGSTVNVTGPDDKPLRPKTIWRESQMYKTPEGDLMSYRDFKKQLDGHGSNVASPVKTRPVSIDWISNKPVPVTEKRLSMPVSDGPPSLSFIPSVGSFIIEDDPVFRTDSMTPQPLQFHREIALNALEGSSGGLALVPPTGLYPAALMAPRFPAALTIGQRPFSCIETVTERTTYRAFHPNMTVVPAPQQMGQAPSDRSVPDWLPQDEPVDHLGHYTRVESGVFDIPAITNTVPPKTTPPPAPVSILRKTPPTLETSVSASDLLSKPLPPTPKPTTTPIRPNLVPTPHKMNDNGFPLIQRKPVAYPKMIRASKAAASKPATQSTPPLALEPSATAGPSARPVSAMSTMTLDAHILKGLEAERRELEARIERQAAKVERKRRARVEGQQWPNRVKF